MLACALVEFVVSSKISKTAKFADPGQVLLYFIVYLKTTKLILLDILQKLKMTVLIEIYL